MRAALIAVALLISLAAVTQSKAPVVSCYSFEDLREPLTILTSATVQIVWSNRPVVENTISAKLCGMGTLHAERASSSGALHISGSQQSSASGVPIVQLSVPWNRMDAIKADSNLTAIGDGVSIDARVSACSDGVDNDGDGLTDQVDPGCDSFSDLSEENPPSSSTNFQFKFGQDAGKVFLQSLTWKGTPVILDPGSGHRFYLHSDSGGVGGKWTSDIQTFEEPLMRDPYKLPPFPWQANTTTYKNQTSPTKIIDNAQIQSTVVSQNATMVIINTTTEVATLMDTFRFEDDVITVSTTVTSLLPPTACADGSAVIYFGTFLGNLQLGNNEGCTCPAILLSGTGRADGHGQANNCTANCKSGLFHLDRLRRGAIQQGQPWDAMRWPHEAVTDPDQLHGWRSVAARGNAYPESSFSPVTALGDTQHFTIGVQVLNPELNSDNTSTYKVEYYDIPAAPTKPLLSQYISAKLLPGQSHTFVYKIKLAAAGQWENPIPAVTAAAQPYADFFAETFGTMPAYCPQGAVGMAFRGSGKKFNRTTHTFAPGSSLYSDDLGIDDYLTTMEPAGMDTVMVWQGQIYSSLITTSGEPYEFNPNSQLLDPNLNEVCDPTWKNVTTTLAKHNLKLGWFGRPCNHILQPDHSSATIECPSKTIKKGEPIKCNLKNLTELCSQASMGTVDDLIAKGVQSFYWDSYLCTGRMTFSQAVTKKYPHSFIMGEQGIDVDSLFTGGLPWMGMQAGVWDPSFEPMNSVLQKIVNPLGTAIVAAYGSDQNVNHTLLSLNASKTNSVMMLVPNFLRDISPRLPPEGLPPQPRGVTMRETLCKQLQVSSENVLWRWNQYGKARGCPKPAQLDPTLCAPLPPIGYVCQNASSSHPAKCVRAWPSSATFESCNASCSSTLSRCTGNGCEPCEAGAHPGQGGCFYNCESSCHPGFKCNHTTLSCDRVAHGENQTACQARCHKHSFKSRSP